ncbi:MAG TPA: ABC transporter permease [Candidatus Acidoferrales bacterium]|nr:ABC transporter permease [Candidatus Acidoferrales bacterium]
MKGWFERRRARDLDRELREEMQFHLEMRAAEYEREGMSPNDSTAAAHKRFGSTSIVHEDTRRMHIGAAASLLETAGREVGFAFRSLRRAPAFTAAAVLALTLGLGGAAAVFSVVDRILFRSLPYSDGNRLVSVGVRAPLADHPILLGGDYSEWKEEHSALDGLTAASEPFDCDLTENNPVRLSCAGVAWTFLPLFGVEPVAGRNIRPEEDLPKAPQSIILSHALWRDRYGADPKIAGRQIQLNGEPATIVGVLPGSFEFPTLAQVDLLVALQLNEPVERKRQAVSMVNAFGRLKSGVGLERARAALEPFFANFLTTITPAFRKEVRLEVGSLNDAMRGRARTAGWVLLGAVAAVLLIAWTNIANLWLARSASRAHEIAIRAALGAGKARLTIHHAAELALIAATGWFAGLGLAACLLAIFRRTAPAGIIGVRHVALDPRIFLFSGTVLLASILGFSLLPTGAVSQGESDVRIAGGRKMRLRNALVTAQLAISVFLVASAGLLIHTLRELSDLRFGVRTEGTVTASAVLGQQKYRTIADRYAFVNRLEDGLRRLPGVSAVAVADELPPLTAGMGIMYGSISIDGRPPSGQGRGGNVNLRHITPEYFRALGIELLRGRPFMREEMNSADGSVILSDRLARRLFPNQDPAGHFIKPAGFPKTYTVVGVAADVKNAGLTAEDAPELYFPYDSTRSAPRFVSAVVRSAAKPALVARLMADEIRAMDAELPVTIGPFNDRIARLNARPRFNAALLSMFAGIGVLLAALGVYGVLAFLVTQRVREIGVRMALGATRGRVLAWILCYVMSWTAAGLALGVAGAFAAARQFRSMLYGVTPSDPWTLATVVVLLACVSALAAYVPARRAATLDPAATLRHD